MADGYVIFRNYIASAKFIKECLSSYFFSDLDTHCTRSIAKSNVVDFSVQLLGYTLHIGKRPFGWIDQNEMRITETIIQPSRPFGYADVDNGLRSQVKLVELLNKPIP